MKQTMANFFGSFVVTKEQEKQIATCRESLLLSSARKKRRFGMAEILDTFGDTKVSTKTNMQRAFDSFLGRKVQKEGFWTLLRQGFGGQAGQNDIFGFPLS